MEEIEEVCSDLLLMPFFHAVYIINTFKFWSSIENYPVSFIIAEPWATLAQR